tara:strand:- start:935 stop:1462 length:528 start_codon:yes stop_codon:yes gene_type:complete
MAIKIKIVQDGVEIEKILLNARKTIDGNIIVSDHPDMQILIIPSKSKIVAMPKEQIDDELYDTQKRLFDYLLKKGVVNYDTIQAGNLFMTKEAMIPDPVNDGDKIQYCLYAISNFIEQEIPFYENMKEYEKEVEKQLLEPEIDEYTEFDPARHGAVKGTLPPRMVKYGIHSIYRL